MITVSYLYHTATGCTMCAEESANGRSFRSENYRESWVWELRPLSSLVVVGK